jgi:hypothetical protein
LGISAAIRRAIDGGVATSAAPAITSTGNFNSLSRDCLMSLASFCRYSVPTRALCSSSTQRLVPSGLAARYEGPSSRNSTGSWSKIFGRIASAARPISPSRTPKELLEMARLSSRSWCENA